MYADCIVINLQVSCESTTADVTPPVLSFTTNPAYSNENVTISWRYNEEATSICSLQSPTATIPILCSNHSVSLAHLTAGLHSLFIVGTDVTGNVASTVRHSWTVGEILFHYETVMHACIYLWKIHSFPDRPLVLQFMLILACNNA